MDTITDIVRDRYAEAARRVTSGQARGFQAVSVPWTGTRLAPNTRRGGRSGRRRVRMPSGTPSPARASLRRAV